MVSHVTETPTCAARHFGLLVAPARPVARRGRPSRVGTGLAPRPADPCLARTATWRIASAIRAGWIGWMRTTRKHRPSAAKPSEAAADRTRHARTPQRRARSQAATLGSRRSHAGGPRLACSGPLQGAQTQGPPCAEPVETRPNAGASEARNRPRKPTETPARTETERPRSTDRKQTPIQTTYRVEGTRPPGGGWCPNGLSNNTVFHERDKHAHCAKNAGNSSAGNAATRASRWVADSKVSRSG